MKKSFNIESNVPMPMSDGTVLRANIYRSQETGPQPVILIRTPYNKDLFARSMFEPVSLMRAGYAVVIQDIRGRYASEGIWERTKMFAVEGKDGADSVQWIADQEWCDGNIALAGASYLTAMQWITAMENPPNLKAFAPCVGDIAPNIAPMPTTGAVSFYSVAGALPRTGFDLIEKMKENGEETTELEYYMEKLQQNPDWFINYLPIHEFPLMKYESFRKMIYQRITPPSFEELETRKQYEKVTAPGLHIGGWFDQLEGAIVENFQQMRIHGGGDSRKKQHLIMGPWDHGNPQTHLGDLEFGASSADMKFLREQVIRFYDKYLLAKDINIPLVTYFVMNRNKWETSEEWPLPQTVWEKWYLHSNGNANTKSGDGLLDQELPEKEPQDVYLYDPMDPVPSIGGRLLPMAGLVPGPKDQVSLEHRKDVLVYTSEPIEETLEITGPVKVHLFAATSAVDTDFTAKLIDVDKEGRAVLITDGIQRASYRNGNKILSQVVPDKIEEYVIQLGNTSYEVQKGHQIRVHISSSNFPLYDRNLNTGHFIGEDSTVVVAKQKIYHQADYASYIQLPVIPKTK